jgi:repressor LexA
MELPKGQRRIWNALLRQRQRSGTLPLANDLSRLIKLHVTTVLQHLEALQSKGLLEINSRGRGRSMELGLTLQGRLEAGIGIPLLGEIAAGPLTVSTQRIEGVLNLPGKPGRFGLWVRGHSMESRLMPRDVVLVQAAATPQVGQVAAVRLGEETTLKRVRLKGSKMILESFNPRYSPIELPADEVEVQGVYHSHLAGELVKELLEVFM